ncbi:MAG: hypothetical protein WC657_07230 [Candidatus Paceibacterota bacterium]|jgi:hypothetical protein
MKILIFTEGTATMQSTAVGVSREEGVRQSVDNIPEVNDFRSYVPNGNVIDKLNKWKSQGAEIYYLTSRIAPEEIDNVKFVLGKYHFPDKQNLLYRNEGQEYKDVAEDLIPDILIEDDCESIGGEIEMTYPHIRPDLKNRIHSIEVKEFAGIDSLPDNIQDLKTYEIEKS